MDAIEAPRPQQGEVGDGPAATEGTQVETASGAGWAMQVSAKLDLLLAAAGIEYEEGEGE